MNRAICQGFIYFSARNLRAQKYTNYEYIRTNDKLRIFAPSKPKGMENIKRIEQMEDRLNRAMDAVREMETALEHYEAVQEDIRILNEYLGSEEWKADFAADEAGLLPADLKRGVLSEDGVWNLLEEWQGLEKRILELVGNHCERDSETR